ncbi:OLC1v1028265C1 [Oldenlandia corymbosa var. corymbosa]|uniref:OLC1v1028265C1 n=1 Tax=Oldenlandia corymbosa var. corymbosa TaxID=529605 RepID=A0AAV1CE78_OLDCO|nr:OLC1v1028265C1 [Oldenlandia corymbosa var. corymbosa]
MVKLAIILLSFFLSSLISSFVNGDVAAGTSKKIGQNFAGKNPFTAKASLIRYWKKQISNNLSTPSFFLNKASPLNAVELATFSKLIDQNSTLTSGQLQDLCSKANLLCAPDSSTTSPATQDAKKDVNFDTYSEQNFTNYGTKRRGGADTFTNYSNFEGLPVNNFRRYSRNSVEHDGAFANYGLDGNVADQSFNGYGKTAKGGRGNFENYQEAENIPNLKFNSYNENAKGGRTQDFSSYSNEANGGEQHFKSYDKNGVGPRSDFLTYSNHSNVVVSSFSHYGENGNGTQEHFTQYGFDSNVPLNRFTTYSERGGGTVIFQSYTDDANIGDDTFSSYGKKSTSSTRAFFETYGQSANRGAVNFVSYGENSTDHFSVFNFYGENHNFNQYVKDRAKFQIYVNRSESATKSVSDGEKVNGNNNNNIWVEPGKFFRESMLKTGNIMPMPDIRDKMPKRSFLPRVIAAKLPFLSGNIDRMQEVFHAADGSMMGRMVNDVVEECERAPSPGETKKCVGSGEEMIDFAKSVLGPNIVVRTTENIQGSNGEILIGSVVGINDGNVTKSVSCHESLFPWLLYYCHSVPKVRVYQADILDPKSRAKINRGVAICHVDTSTWGPGHAAFLALGSGPGQIEVCHWIFENDMTWVVADS